MGSMLPSFYLCLLYFVPSERFTKWLSFFSSSSIITLTISFPKLISIFFFFTHSLSPSSLFFFASLLLLFSYPFPNSATPTLMNICAMQNSESVSETCFLHTWLIMLSLWELLCDETIQSLPSYRSSDPKFMLLFWHLIFYLSYFKPHISASFIPCKLPSLASETPPTEKVGFTS